MKTTDNKDKKKKNRKRQRSLSTDKRVNHDHKPTFSSSTKNNNDAGSREETARMMDQDPSSSWALLHSRSSYQDDTTVVLAAMDKNPFVFKYASERLRNDKNFVLEAVKKDGMLILWASEQLQDDADVVLAAAKTAYNTNHGNNNDSTTVTTSAAAVMQFASEKRRDDKELVMQILQFQRGWQAIPYVSKRLQEDREVALLAVAKDGSKAFRMLSPTFRKDKTIVLQAVTANGGAILQDASSEQFWDDKEIVLQAVQHKDCAYMFVQATERLRHDKEVVKAAISKNVFLLQHASEEMQSDPEILRVARESALKAFRGGNHDPAETKRFRELIPPLQDDQGIVETAIRSPYFSPVMLSHMSERLQENGSMFQLALDRQRTMLLGVTPPVGGHVLDFAPLSIRLDLEIEELRRDCTRFRQLPEELCHNRDFCLAAVTANSKVLRLLSATFKADREIVLKAIEQDACSIMHASVTLKADRTMVLRAVKKNGIAIKYVAEPLKADRQIAMAAVQHTGVAIQFLAETLKADPCVALAAAEKSLCSIQYLAEPLKSALRNDPAVVAKAVETNHHSAFWGLVGDTLKTRFASAISGIKTHCGCADSDEMNLTLADVKSITRLSEDTRRSSSERMLEEQVVVVANDIQHCAPLLVAFAGSRSLWDDTVGMRWRELPLCS
jgi:Domain of unknown function (DUF4116)